MLKLSIITINYNNLPGLTVTIDSVLKQSYSNFEYIIIDGNSTDGSKELIEQYGTRFSYWVSEQDTGVYHAMNKGILKANGEYCLFLNSGDYLVHPEILHQLFTLPFQEDIVYGDLLLEDETKNRTLSKQPSVLTFEHFISSTLWHPVSFIKKSLFVKYGLYNEALKIVADYDFFLKTIIVNQVSYKYIPLPISVYNIHGISSAKENEHIHLLERKKVLETYFPVSVIEAGKKLEALNGSKIITLYNWFQKHPGLLRIISKCSSLFNRRS